MDDLPTRLRDNLCGIDEADERLAHEAADEIERLQAIVDALPKCWRLTDGVLVKDVPVVPGMTIYYLDGVGQIKQEYLGSWRFVVAMACAWGGHDLYATEAAAQAALDAKEEGDD